MTSNQSQLDDESGKYLNNILNNSNSSPELIEYYDVDDVSTAPDAIYPDPESIFNQNRNGMAKTMVATKFNKLEELSRPMGDDLNAKDDGNGGGGKRRAGGGAISSIDFDARSEIHETIESGPFNGKSIDFNIRHSMEELKNEGNEDLRDHDIIDNIMYIYYGSNVALRKSLGGSIIIAGTVFALAAQILAIIFTLLRNR